MRLIPKQLNETGDTLVEVIIAVAIISSVLAGAFLVSQKSTQAVRASQEQGEMLQILQGQVEAVRSIALDSDAGDMDAHKGIYKITPQPYFCIDTVEGSSTKNMRVNFSGVIKKDYTKDTYDVYNDNCKDLEGRYNVAIAFDKDLGVFNFYGRWDRLGGDKKQVQLVYRIYPGKPATP